MLCHKKSETRLRVGKPDPNGETSMNISRLWACAVILSAGLRLMLAGNSATFAQTQAHTNKPFVIDGHRHVGDGGFLENRFSTSHLIEEMDRLGIDKAVILPMGEMSTTAEEDQHKMVEMEKANDDYFNRNIMSDVVKKMQSDRMDHTEVINAIRLYPSRLVGVYMVNPWLGKPELQEAGNAIQNRGFRGIKLHPMLNAFRADDAVVDPVLKLARHLKIPVMFHTSFAWDRNRSEWRKSRCASRRLMLSCITRASAGFTRMPSKRQKNTTTFTSTLHMPNRPRCRRFSIRCLPSESFTVATLRGARGPRSSI